MVDNREKILIVDDSEINRDLLKEILCKDYCIIEAENGDKAIEILEESHEEIDLILLDAVMNGKDGFEVLTAMNNKLWIDSVPVIMISCDTTPYYMRRAYGLGVSDYIPRPFDSVVLRRRVANTLALYCNQKKLVSLLVKQIYQREKNSNLMANILGHIVEFRGGKSGSHVLNVGVITKILLEGLNDIDDKYNFSYDDMLLISTAATLHDIGKITIPEEIAYKTGKLTDEEFEIMKNHSAAGCCILDEMKIYKDEPLIKMAYKICRWHHERYDGKGYPDALLGDDIPIEAQVVGLADAYDVLTSERVYKDALSHERAYNMIINGECGAFTPDLIESFKNKADEILDELKLNPLHRNVDHEIHRTMEEFFGKEEDYILKSLFKDYLKKN